MERVPVISDACRAVGYDAAAQRLEVEFHPKNGVAVVWQYEPVSQDEHDRMMFGESIGRALAEIRRRADIVSTRVEDVTIEADHR